MGSTSKGVHRVPSLTDKGSELGRRRSSPQRSREAHAGHPGREGGSCAPSHQRQPEHGRSCTSSPARATGDCPAAPPHSSSPSRWLEVSQGKESTGEEVCTRRHCPPCGGAACRQRWSTAPPAASRPLNIVFFFIQSFRIKFI